MRRFVDNLALAVAVAWFLCMCAPVTLGQAGGGGSFGGSGGGGGGEFAIAWELIELLIRFTIHYPQYGIPIWIVLGIGLYYVKKSEKNFRITRTIRKGRKVQEAGLRSMTLERIRKNDPDFSEAVFLERAEKGFIDTQQAWSDQDLRGCRAFISDGVHERFLLYIAMQKAENIRNRMRGVRVRKSRVVAVTNDTHFDTIHVQFTAQAISYDEDLDSGKRVGGNSDSQPTVFGEVWSFSRRPGVRTQPEASLMQGNCPNCGGSVDIVDVAKCPHCESQVNSGQYDWVLAEITQAEEWVVPPVTNSVRGWSALAKKDPALNFQHLEDRASVAFWRCLMAVYFEDIGYAAPIMARNRDTLPDLWRLPAGRFWKTPAVGSVQVRLCEPARDDDNFDRIHVLVRWSGRRAEGNRRRPKVLELQRIYSHVMVLKRQVGVSTKIERAFASLNCDNCGAPIEVGKAAVCRFCETTLNDGTRDWVLEDVKPFAALSAYQREDRRDKAANLGPGVERLEDDRFINEPELLTALTRIVAADGVLHDKERDYLTRLAQRRGVSEERLEKIMLTALDESQPIQLPENTHQAGIFIDHLVRAALIDGRITRKERKLLVEAGTQLNWREADLRMAIARNRKELYQQAKKIIKNSRL